MNQTHFEWKRGQVIQLSKNFWSYEFDCNCRYSDCVDQRISRDLVTKLQGMRDQLGSTIQIVSGFRCARYQAELLGNPNVETVKNSQHLLGNAVDPFAPGHQAELIKLAPLYFQAVGAGPNQLHVDTRADKPRRWSYK